MVFINHELKAIYIHNPKCGGVYTRTILQKFYGFTLLTDQFHYNYADFFEDRNDIKLFEDTDGHTIRKYGKLRYHLNHQYVNIHFFKHYFIFTFVRDPYAKLFSAYSYLNKCLINNELIKIRESFENKDYFVDFETFIQNKEKVNNISYFHAFITQENQLINWNNKLKINYIGRQENLDNDLINILILLGVKEMKHLPMIFQNIQLNKTKDDNVHLPDVYNEQSFQFVNEYFAKDFELFQYKKYRCYDDFKRSYQKNNKKYDYSITNLFKENNMILHNNLVQENINKDIFSNLNSLFELCETNNVNIDSSKKALMKCWDMKKELVQKMQIDGNNLIMNIFRMNKAFKKRHYKCKICNNFSGSNKLSIYSHKRICKNII